MAANLRLSILRQPDDTTCGPTCLHAVYRFFGDAIGLNQVIRETQKLEGGGTLAVMLGLHALSRGFRARVYTYNLEVFDPTWFYGSPRALAAKLEKRGQVRPTGKLRTATRAYQNYLGAGGQVRFEDLTKKLIRGYLNRGLPILTGLSATYLYRSARVDAKGRDDDIGGSPEGHFVVLCGYDRGRRQVLVADPSPDNPAKRHGLYWVDMDRLLNSILLGILTYDANLLIIQPAKGSVGEGTLKAPDPRTSNATLSSRPARHGRRYRRR